jgi:hypothetical protein
LLTLTSNAAGVVDTGGKFAVGVTTINVNHEQDVTTPVHRQVALSLVYLCKLLEIF